MKKKRLRLVTTIALLAALAGGSGGVAWGQAYKKAYISGDGRAHFRRGDATNPATIREIGVAGVGTSPGNVNTEFGAGESSTIQGMNVVVAGKTNLGTGHAFKPSITPATDIQIGSDYSKNIVVLSYNSKGYASGWVNITCWGITNQYCITIASGSDGELCDRVLQQLIGQPQRTRHRLRQREGVSTTPEMVLPQDGRPELVRWALREEYVGRELSSGGGVDKACRAVSQLCAVVAAALARAM